MSPDRSPPPLTPYEAEQLRAVQRWKSARPRVAAQALDAALSPVAWVLARLVPPAALRGALHAAAEAGKRTTDAASVCRLAGVGHLQELQRADLDRLDAAAGAVHSGAVGLAFGQGAAAGVAGALGAPLDFPALLLIAMRTIYRVSLCYGYDVQGAEDRRFLVGVLAAASANSVNEKKAALRALGALELYLARQASGLAGLAARRALGCGAAVLGTRRVAEQVGVNLARRKALAALPYLGAAVGGSFNAWYIRDVGWAARRAFQERWLLDRGKL
ncbi:MAG: hypothetical protein Kow0092_38370 [Deferrisomatales bacterium]